MTSTLNPRRLLGFAPVDERHLAAHAAERAAQSKRERLALAAIWATANGRACTFDSKGWPLDEHDLPLAPRLGSIPETVRAHRHATTMAKTRKARRARAALDTFDLRNLRLDGVVAYGSLAWLFAQEERRRADAEMRRALW